jgi:hypothetical protein
MVKMTKKHVKISLILLIIKEMQIKTHREISIVGHACNPSTPEAEAGGLQVQGQYGLHTKTTFPKKISNKKVATMR